MILLVSLTQRKLWNCLALSTKTEIINFCKILGLDIILQLRDRVCYSDSDQEGLSMQNTWCETSGGKDLDTKQAEVYRPFKSGYFCLILL